MTQKKETKKETVYAKHFFTETEMKDIASTLARKIQENKAAEDEKKSIMSSFTARLTALMAGINLLSDNYRNGYDYRNMECIVKLDFDNKIKRFILEEDGEVVKEEPLSPEDYQEKLL